ncbi:ABC transporter ATP-binding protein [Paenibacillus sp. EKM208P]|nr:ABC transporter ATP-binding protein [Paenibacillus sp. EKM208P]
MNGIVKNNFGVIDSVRFLSRYLKKYKRSFILFFIGWLMEGILQLIIPVMFGILIDEMVYYKNLSTFYKISLVIVILSLFLCVLYFVIYTFFNHIVGRYSLDIKIDLFDRLLSLKPGHVEKIKAGDIINTIQAYTHECVLFITRNLVYTVYCSLMIGLYSTYIFMINWRIGLIFVVFVPFSTWMTLHGSKKTRIYSDKYKGVYGGYIGWLFEVLKGTTDLRILGAGNNIRRKFVQKQRQLFTLLNKRNLYNLTIANGVEVINTFMQITIFGVGAYMTIHGDMTLGLFIVMVTFFSEIKANIIWLNGYYIDLQDRLSAVKYIKEFSDIQQERTGGEKLIVRQGDVEFLNIGFTHTGREELFDGLNLHIRANERVAIIGKTGSGKSTLASMLVGFNSPSQGTILVDGQDLEACSLKSIRQEIGIVQQNVLVFDGTIKENIMLGKLKATDEEIIAACEKSGLFTLIKELELGLDTLVGSKGISLSGGQKQLISITRIYLKSPKIIILDEATSSLDSWTELNLHQSWDHALKGSTVIVITHKPSSLAYCHRAVLLDEGKIAFDGTPEELIHENIRYKEIFSAQEVVS